MRQRAEDRKFPTISYKQLIKLVVEQSEYHKYEVEDLLKSLAVVISYAVHDGYKVQFRGLGSFEPKPSRRVKTTSGFTGEKIDKMSSQGCIFRPDKCFKNLINGDYGSIEHKFELPGLPGLFELEDDIENKGEADEHKK